jgi:hypothetical protein
MPYIEGMGQLEPFTLGRITCRLTRGTSGWFAVRLTSVTRSRLSIPIGYRCRLSLKGRVEWLLGTLQYRLVSELRLAGVQTLQEANQLLVAFLPRFNASFGVPADDPKPACRLLDPVMYLRQICSFGYLRTVAHDDSLRLGDHHLQLGPRHNRLTCARTTVEVREHLDGSLSIWHADQQIGLTPAPTDAPQLQARGGLRSPAAPPSTPSADAAVPDPQPSADGSFPPERRKPRTTWKPAADHSWRR